MKTYLTEASILSVYDFKNNEKNLLGKFLFGIVNKDETNRFEPNFRIITSTIKSQNHLEFITKSNSCYVIDSQPDHFDISFVEFIVMRHRLYSPSEILELRQTLKLNDDRTIH
jgi:hypothetical protein